MQHRNRLLCLAVLAMGCSQSPSSSPEPPASTERPAIGDASPAAVLPTDTWTRQVQSNAPVLGAGLAVDALGRVVWGGDFYPESDFGGGRLKARGFHDGFVVQYDRDGRFRWQRQLFGGLLHVLGLAQDRRNNVALFGTVADGLDAGGGLLTLSAQSMLVAKYDEDGKYRWSRPLPETPASVVAARFDSLGNLYIAGFFQETIDLGSGPISSGTRKSVTFVAKLDPDGKTLWTRAIGGGDPLTVGYSIAAALTVDATDSVIVATSFWGTQDFGAGPITSQGHLDVVVAKYDASGRLLFTRPIGGPGADVVGDMQVSGTDNLFVITNVDTRYSPVLPYPSRLVRIGADGTLHWSRPITSTPAVAASALTLDGNQAVLVGTITEALNFGVSTLDPACGVFFLARYDEAGSPLWARCIGVATLPHRGLVDALALDGANRILMAGSGSPGIVFPVHRSEIQTSSSPDSQILFLARLAL